MTQTATVHFAKLGKPQLAFMAWLQKTHPKLYAQAVPDTAGMSGILDSITTGFNSILANSTALLSQYVSGKQQMQLLKINLQRAKQGLQPTDGLPISAGAPQPGFFSSVPPAVWIIGGLGAAYLLFFRRK